MAGLTDEQKARIRAEEEARATALAEERYRQQVRAELEAKQQAELEEAYRHQVRAEIEGQPAVPGPPPATPTPAPPPRPIAAAGAEPSGLGKAVGLWLGAGILAAGAIAMAVVALTGGSGEAAVDPGVPDDGAPPDIVAAGDGALAPVAAAKWDPAALGFEGFEDGPDGAVRKVAAAPVKTFDELKASAETPRAPRTVVPESSLSDLLDRAEKKKGGGPVDAGRWDAMLEYAPADTRLLVGVDGAALNRSTIGRRLFDDLVTHAGSRGVVDALREAGALRVPEDVGAALFIATEAWEERDDAFVLGVAGAFDGRRVADFFTSKDPPVQWYEGPPPRVESRHGGAVVGDGFVIVGELDPFKSSLRARAGNNASLSPRVGPALRQARGAPSVFVVFDLSGEWARDLGRELPDLAGAKALLVRADLRDGAKVEASLTLADADAAKRVALVLEAARASGKEPALTRLLEGVRFGTDGPRVVASREMTDAQALALYQAILATDP